MSDEPIPRDKVVQIAQNYRELEVLRRKQAETQATMIRACVERIERQPGPFDDAERRRKIVSERRMAIAGLLDLAKMLDQQSVGSSDT